MWRQEGRRSVWRYEVGNDQRRDQVEMKKPIRREVVRENMVKVDENRR